MGNSLELFGKNEKEWRGCKLVMRLDGSKGGF